MLAGVNKDVIIKGLNDDAYFIAKDYYKNVFIGGVIIIRLFDGGGVIIARSSFNGNDKDNENVINDDVISISYFCIKFIALFKYLTLYHVSYFES